MPTPQPPPPNLGLKIERITEEEIEVGRASKTTPHHPPPPFLNCSRSGSAAVIVKKYIYPREGNIL